MDHKAASYSIGNNFILIGYGFLSSIGRLHSLRQLINRVINTQTAADTEELRLNDWMGSISFNPIMPKRRPLYLKTQSVPRCKHFSSLL